MEEKTVKEPETKICPYCLTEIKYHATRCPNCTSKLETEKKAIEEGLCSGTLSVEDLTEKSKRLPVLNEELDKKSMRWLELSEIEE